KTAPGLFGAVCVLLFYAMDLSGNKSDTVRLTLLVVNSSDITITYPSNEQFISTDKVDIQGVVNLDQSMISGVYLSIDNTSDVKISDTKEFNYLVTGLTEKRYQFSVYATDKSGKKIAINIVNVNVDLTKPIVIIESPSVDSTYTGSSINVSGRVTDLNATHKIYISIDSGVVDSPVSNQSGPIWSHNFSGLTKGTHTISVVATDIAGNSSEVSKRIIIVDFATITFLKPLMLEKFSKNDLITFSALVESDSGITAYQWFDEAKQITNELPVANLKSTTLVLVKKGSELVELMGGKYGIHRIRLVVKDALGNTNDVFVDISVLDHVTGGINIQF
ncbi:MAG TPA: Ig-like domain-containing protein, partial [Spirochaetota bacterium]|nr:Ig-like domain-containing protein [Spirochaetota bacterium]